LRQELLLTRGGTIGKRCREDAPIVLGLLDSFDNWCEAQLHRQKVTFRDLTEDRRQKLLYAVAAIHHQFELSWNPKVTIGWVVSSITENHEARRLALEFLQNKDVVMRHEFHYTGGGSIEIELNIREFFRLRDELLAYYRDVTHSTAETPTDHGSTAGPSNAFRSIEGLRWQEIQIRFLDGDNVRITAKETTATVGYKEMGFEDSRNHNPNTQWALLKILAQNECEISWEDASARDNIKKQKQLLSEKLQAYFGIEEDPFHPYKERKAYRIKITLLPES